ncbi:GerMN domain-containing protein [bacterium]|nr:GerMN domain-containing protein [bacterium]
MKRKRIITILGVLILFIVVILLISQRERVFYRIPFLAPEENVKLVRLYFASPDADYLKAEARRILREERITDEAKALVEELIKGPRGNLDPTIPPETQLRELYIVPKEKCVYLDFNQAFRTNHPGGSAGELLTIYSLVNTLIDNLEEIERVQILVEGGTIETLAGHIDITKPLSRNAPLVEY